MTHNALAIRIYDELTAVLGPLHSAHLDRDLDVSDVLDAVHLTTDDDQAEHGAVIVHGTLSDGFEFIGPFADFDAASEYADDAGEIDKPTWIATLFAPGADRV